VEGGGDSVSSSSSEKLRKLNLRLGVEVPVELRSESDLRVHTVDDD
jgi:hypothetical protein